MNFKKGQKVVRVIRVLGTETASLTEVEKVTKAGVVKVKDYDHIKYRDSDGAEDPPSALSGCSSRIIALEE